MIEAKQSRINKEPSKLIIEIQKGLVDFSDS